MNINGNYKNSWIYGYESQQPHQIFYTTMHQQGYYPNIEHTNFGNIIAKTTGFSNQPQQRNHQIMTASSSGYINIREHHRNRYPINCNVKQQNSKNCHPQHNQQFQPQQHQQHHQQHPPPQNMTNNNNGIINGLKNFVNGFINPKLNSNFYTDNHHRNYYPKYRNNFMRNEQIDDNTQNKQNTQNYQTIEPHIQTVFFNLTVEPKIINSTTQLTTKSNYQKPVMESTIDEVDHCHRPSEKSDNIAIFTLDDFPALPIPKQKNDLNLWTNEKSKDSCPFYGLKGNLNKSNKNNKMKQNKMKEENISTTNITTKPPSIDDDDYDSSDNCSFNIDNGGCSNSSSNNNNGLINNISTNTENVQQKRLQNNRKESECDSEDSFVIFTKQSPSNHDTIVNCHSNINKVNNSNAGTTPFRPRIRERQISECSDDSFIICFTDDAAEGVIEYSDGITSSDDDDDDDSTDDDSSDYETDDDDEIIDETSTKNHNVVINKKNNSNNLKTETNNIDGDILSINGGHGSQPDSGFDERKEKKVRFNLNLEVHTMHTWSFAYRAARKGHWENYVRDRSRFGDRIERLSSILNPILDSKHRDNIYKLRFCDNNIDTIS